MDINRSWSEECFKCTFLSVDFVLHLGKPSCKSWQFQCNNGKCIHSSRICNGYDSCGDNSDESKKDGAFCGMLNYVFAVVTYILKSTLSKLTCFKIYHLWKSVTL